MEASRKRMRKAAEESNGEGGGGGGAAAGGRVEEEEGAVEETNEGAVSEEMEAKIQAIFERIERFTQQVSEMLETGKAMLSNLSQQFEERLIAIHKEQVDKWQEEIKELRSLDSSNAATHALLQNAQFHLFQSVTEEDS